MRALIVVLGLAVWPTSSLARNVPSTERVTCSLAASLKYRLPPELLLAVAEMEGGKPGQWVKNANGSHDVGPMQFNTKYLAHLHKRYGITAADVAASGCYPFELAAWRLRRHLDRDRGDFWTRAANYHSRAPHHNAKYRRKLVRKAATWQAWLRRNYPKATAVSSRETSRASHTAARAQRSEQQNDSEPRDAYERELLDRLGSFEPVPGGNRSKSAGRPHAGMLVNAVRVARHRGYTVLEPERAWGTAAAVRWLAEAFDALRQLDPGAPAIQVHDMSLEHGGAMRGHRSHQTGRDVDLTYFHARCRSACGQRALKPDDLDAKRQWRLISHWIARGQLELAFVDYALQEPLHAAAREAGATPEQLQRWFQYPRGSTARAGLIRHAPNHADHVHVRFRCAASDDGCQGRKASHAPGPMYGLGSSDEAELLRLLE